MSRGGRHLAPKMAVIVFLGLLLPPARHALQASMTAQMLVQIPLLTVVGYLLRNAVPEGVSAIIGRWNHLGISGLVLASLAGACWMLPRSLDAAVTEPWVEAAKLISVPLLIGLPFGLSWPRMDFVVRGVFLTELIASFFRLGWLYRVSPVRLCNSYLLGDQQRLGNYMLAAGVALLIGVVGMLLWGRFDSLHLSERMGGRISKEVPGGR
ncbi:MAG: hypothetical protein ACRET5_11520 [Steroidobacteraceae bacterium]